MMSRKWNFRGAPLVRLALSITLMTTLAPATVLAADPTARLGEGLKQLVAPPVATPRWSRRCNSTPPTTRWSEFR
jgi:hypothetical protein